MIECIYYSLSGGPGQIAHLAPTYAAVNALCLLRNKRAYKVIDR
jgi:protein farnesyltransferase subunit beta